MIPSFFKLTLATTSAIAMLAACVAVETPAPKSVSETAPAVEAAAETVAVQTESERLNIWFEEQFEANVGRSPVFLTYLGQKARYGEWDDVSPEFKEESYKLSLAALEEMKAEFDYNALDEASQLSWRLFEFNVEQEKEGWTFRDHWYTFSAFRGPHSSTPAFMINQHQIKSVEDAEAYISRLEGWKDYFAQEQANAERQFEAGIYPPDWSYPKMIATSENIIKGAPFDDSEEPSTLMADFTGKLGSLEIEEDAKADLIARAEAAMISSVKPAYEDLIGMFEAQGELAGDPDGVWKLPDGGEYYSHQLKKMTTTDMTAAEVHQLGLDEVARIHGEMSAIKEQVGFEGTLQDFFEYMREDPDNLFTYSTDDEGRQRYLKEAVELIDTMEGRLDELFYVKPKAEMIVKRVEEFREKSAGKAFYQRPAPDGSRPGIYYANLFDMANMPTYQMEALAYHEGIPGHHMQIAIAQELEQVPSFRKYGGFTAYIEGWGLYSEYIPKEMGFYADPYSDFGRLAMELWRAARLVVDTGLHDKKWSREDAIDYLVTNTPNPEGDCINAIERYIVYPGQATAYKIGMNKILELRTKATDALGDRFDIRGFHDVVLKNGAVPLQILEENVDAWIEAEGT